MGKIQIIEKLFFYINSYSYLLLPLTLLFLKTKKREAIIVGIYGAIFFFPVFFGSKTPSEFRKLFLLSYTFLEYCFFSYLIGANIRNEKIKKVIWVLSTCFLIFQVYIFLLGKISRLDSVSIGIETLLLFIYILFFFYEQFVGQRVSYIYNNNCFWLSFGILLYLGGSFFFNILANIVDKKEIDNYWYLTLIAEFIKNILFMVAIIIAAKKIDTSKLKQKSSSIPFLDLDITP